MILRLRKNNRFKWTANCQKAFNELKRGLCSDKEIASWAPNLSTKLVVEPRPVGTAAILLQLDPEQNAWRNIKYASRRRRSVMAQ